MTFTVTVEKARKLDGTPYLVPQKGVVEANNKQEAIDKIKGLYGQSAKITFK